MSSVRSVTANLKRNEFVVTTGTSLSTFDNDATAGATLTVTAGTLYRVYGKKVVTPAQGTAAAGANQVVLLKIGRVSTATNAAASGTSATPDEGDCTSTLPVYVNLLSGQVARV
jgi:hypothetical protein